MEEKSTPQYSKSNPALQIGLCIITFGTYFVYWTYLKNLQFEKLSKKAPDSTRAITLMAILPLSWFFISHIIKTFSYNSLNLKQEIFILTIWILIAFLNIKYYFDFLQNLSKITKTKTILEFILFNITTFTIITTSIFSINLIFIPILLLGLLNSIMQTKLNILYKNLNYKHDKNKFYK